MLDRLEVLHYLLDSDLREVLVLFVEQIDLGRRVELQLVIHNMHHVELRLILVMYEPRHDILRELVDDQLLGHVNEYLVEIMRVVVLPMEHVAMIN